jgi:hypothetical protein
MPTKKDKKDEFMFVDGRRFMRESREYSPANRDMFRGLAIDR